MITSNHAWYYLCNVYDSLFFSSTKFAKTHLLDEATIKSIKTVISSPECATAAQLAGVLSKSPNVCKKSKYIKCNNKSPIQSIKSNK